MLTILLGLLVLTKIKFDRIIISKIIHQRDKIFLLDLNYGWFLVKRQPEGTGNTGPPAKKQKQTKEGRYTHFNCQMNFIILCKVLHYAGMNFIINLCKVLT